jgi:hypothetical protein
MGSFKQTLLVVITSGGLAVGLPGMAHAAPAGSMAGEIIISNNIAKDVTDFGGLSIDLGGLGAKIGKLPLPMKVGGQMGNPQDTETVVQGVRHNGTLPVPKIVIYGNRAEEITNWGGRVIVQGVSVR